MSTETWRVTREEVRELLSKYESATDSDAAGLLRPTARERQLLGEQSLALRKDHVTKARAINRSFVEAFIADLPDTIAAPQAAPARPVAELRVPIPATPTLPVSSYGSIASLFLHLYRDWSVACDHVMSTTYNPALLELQKLLPKGGEVLVPGCGLGRLALTIASAEPVGAYKVEANDASRLFVSAADWILNRGPAAGQLPLHPLAHVFSETWSHAQQYVEIAVPGPAPQDLAQAVLSAGPAVKLVPGDFAATYGPAGPCHRKFDAIVTSFFMDTTTDFAELVEVMDGLLGEGGVWVNIGPLNFRSDARLKLTWEEIVGIWENLGYEFVTQSRADVDYHIPRGQKMYTESYNCALTAAVKRRGN